MGHALEMLGARRWELVTWRMYLGGIKGTFSLVYRYGANIIASEMATDSSLKMAVHLEQQAAQSAGMLTPVVLLFPRL